MAKHLRTMGAPFGITFADFTNLSNSRNAHLAAEFAREKGRFHDLHMKLFAAYFSEGLDIGDLEVLAELGKDAGLDSAELVASVHGGKYAGILKTVQEQAVQRGVSGVPAFFIADREKIVGAQPIEVFRKILKTIESQHS